VVASLLDANYAVGLVDGRTVTAHLPGKIRRQHSGIVPGDRVKVEFLPHETEWEKIVRRRRWPFPDPIDRFMVRLLERKPALESATVA
jgi:translation initiation factor IF-1